MDLLVSTILSSLGIDITLVGQVLIFSVQYGSVVVQGITELDSSPTDQALHSGAATLVSSLQSTKIGGLTVQTVTTTVNSSSSQLSNSDEEDEGTDLGTAILISILVPVLIGTSSQN